MTHDAQAAIERRRPGFRTVERLEGWGMAVHGISHVYRPRSAEEIAKVYQLAKETGHTIGFRGAGCSYGDAALNEGGIVLDLSAMNRILEWSPETGRIVAEPGVTILQLWQTILPDGWWPPVVSGTMFTTMGGCASMNIHGKNNFKVGTFGEHVVEFDLLLPTGESKTCSPTQNTDLYYGAISGFGMLGCFTRLVLQMKRVYSGQLLVEAFNTSSLGEMASEFEDRAPESDYLVGWVDCIKGGRKLGRGIVHQARYLEEGVDRRPRDLLTIAAQELPSKIMGLFPKSMTYLLLGPFINNFGVRMINAAKFWWSAMAPRSHCYYQTHAAFAFLLDYVPNWKLAYSPVGLIQYQSFIPREAATVTFEALLRMSRKAGLPPYLGVFKKHRPDPFLLTHSVDGYSLALDYRVTRRNRERLWRLAGEMDKVVLDNGGKFYFAKDATLTRDAVSRFFPAENLERFRSLKRECDPDNLFQTNLSRRLFGDPSTA
ncbi:MAG: FAD-binding oxidoreductase [Candidatus Sumerlaeaceae bacterium]|nr:FAD-binding oxidoreductase [Candidatus Sumerlaeaceae bacterium]